MAETKLLSPEALARISKLNLVAKQTVQGFITGLHKSPFHGSSVEFADHRPYVAGDEIKGIDWKLWAKTDKYYIKLFEDQTNVRCTIMVDTSRSMKFSMNHGTKRHYAAQLAAALSYLMIRQSDSVGLVLFDQEVREFLPASSTPTHFRLLLERLADASTGGETDLAGCVHPVANRLKGRGMVIIISDLLDDPSALADAIAHLQYSRNEVIVFHVMDAAECVFPFSRTSRFKDMELGSELIANPNQVRNRYMTNLQNFLDQARRTCLERNASYVLARTDEPFEEMLSAYLAARAGGR